MARIKIADISIDKRLSKEDLKRVAGGFVIWDNQTDERVKPSDLGDKTNQKANFQDFHF